jgi:hypothetical protein
MVGVRRFAPFLQSRCGYACGNRAKLGVRPLRERGPKRLQWRAA